MAESESESQSELQCCSQRLSDFFLCQEKEKQTEKQTEKEFSTRIVAGHWPMATANDLAREQRERVQTGALNYKRRRWSSSVIFYCCCCCYYCCSLVAFHSWLFFSCCLATSSSNKHYEHAHNERLVSQSYNQLPATAKAPQTTTATAKLK